MNPMEPTLATKPPLPPLPQKRALEMSEMPHNLHQIEEMGNLVLKGDSLQKYMEGQEDSFNQEFKEFKERVRGYMKAAPASTTITSTSRLSIVELLLSFLLLLPSFPARLSITHRATIHHNECI